MNKIILLFCFFQFILNLLFGQNTDSLTTENFYKNVTLRVANSKGKKFNTFSEKTIYGKNKSNKDFLNKTTFVNFGFQACAPCVLEESSINMLSRKYKNSKKFQILNFTFDSPINIKKLRKQHHLEYENFISITQDKCFKLNFMSGFPTVFIIDSNGIIAYAKAGGGPTKDETIRYFQNEFIPVIDSLLERDKILTK